MPEPRRRPGVSAEDLSGAVRVHADRVHDAVRRLGCSPVAAVQVVEESALDLVDVVARKPSEVDDLVGWWFARARALGRRVADGAGDLPVGGGLLSADEDQALLSEVLERMPERERVALLLRDSYALPASTVGAALGTDPDAAMEVVGRARATFLPLVDEGEVPALDGHAVDAAALARLAARGPVAARDATTHRHVLSCELCTGVVEGQARAHLLLAGLTVVAVPLEDRDVLLSRVDTKARAVLPSAASLVMTEDELLDEEDEAEQRRLLSPLVALLLLGLAVLAGLGVGILLSRDPGVDTRAAAGIGVPSLEPLPSPSVLSVSVPPPPKPPTLPPPSVFIVTPSAAPTSASPPAAASTAPAPSETGVPGEQLAVSLSPRSGPNGTQVTVTGTGWTPGTVVQVDYLDTFGRETGSSTSGIADASGAFTATLTAADPTGFPGNHEVRASNAEQTASTTFRATA